MYNYNKAQQSKKRVHISWDILYMPGLGLSQVDAAVMNLKFCCTYNSFRPSDANMRHCTRTSLVQIKACRLFGDVMILTNHDQTFFTCHNNST